jgi:hypothetical protein
MALYRTLFVEMAREEFRMHSDLFGGRRFAAFPLWIAAMAAGAVWLLTAFTDTGLATLVAGLHALVFFFGLHTGSIGVVGRDAMRNLLGDRTLLVFSARTLPLSQRRLLAVFLVKDLAYYAVLFLLPLSLAFAVGGLGAEVVVLWLSATLTFALGLTTTFAAIGLTTRGLGGRLLLAGLLAAFGLAWVGGLDPVAYTPYAVWRDVSPTSVAVAVLPTVLLAALGYVTYDTTSERTARSAANAFDRWHARLPVDDQGLVTKTLLDVHRSSGGFVKVLFSAGVLFAVTVALVDVAESITGVAPSVGVTMGAVLGLSAFTTYNWVTQFDALSQYQAYPVSVAAVFSAKFHAFLVLGVPTGLAYHLVAAVWLGARPGEAAVGAVLLVGLELYLFGLTTYLAGFQPNEFLFDTVLFALFWLAVVVPLVPVLVVALVLAPVSTPLLAALAVTGVVLAGAGHVLFGRAVSKWTAKYRAE